MQWTGRPIRGFVIFGVSVTIHFLLCACSVILEARTATISPTTSIMQCHFCLAHPDAQLQLKLVRSSDWLLGFVLSVASIEHVVIPSFVMMCFIRVPIQVTVNTIRPKKGAPLIFLMSGQKRRNAETSHDRTIHIDRTRNRVHQQNHRNRFCVAAETVPTNDLLSTPVSNVPMYYRRK